MSSQPEPFKIGDKPASRFSRYFIPPLTLLSLALVALRPILQQNLPCTDDAAFHLLRLTQLDHLISQGVWYSRLAPDMAQGYGYLLFNYYAPLSYYAAELVAQFAGNLHLALRLTFALGLFLSGLSMNAWAGQHVGRGAALAAAVAYMYAPYQAYDILFRGNLAESFAWWLLPSVLYCLHRLVHQRRLGWLAGTAITYAAVLLTHNVFALIFSPILAIYAVWQARLLGPPRRGVWIQVSAALILGLALAAFFWLPALMERELIHAERVLAPPDFVYWGNFLSLKEIFAWPRRVQPLLINPSPPRALGMVLLLLSLPSLYGLWRWRSGQARRQRRQVAFLWILLLGTVFLMTAASRPVWDRVPLLEFVQFPWRWLGPAALLLAMLVGYAIELLQEMGWARVSSWWPAGACLLMIGSVIFWLSPNYCPGLNDPKPADIQTFERETGLIGTTASGEYLPRWVDKLPDQPYSAPFSTNGDVALTQVVRRPLSFSAQAIAMAPTEITVNTLSYPGWHAELNGREAELSRQAETGLLAIQVPTGKHQIQIAFNETRLRLAADLVSLLALVIVAGLLSAAVITRWGSHPAMAQVDGRDWHSFLLPAGSGLLSLLLLQPFNPIVYSEDRQGQDETSHIHYQDGFMLVDLEWDSDSSQPLNQPLPLTLTWQAERRQSRRLQATVRLRGPNDLYWSAKETTRPRVFRPAYGSQFWEAGHYAQDMHLVSSLPGTPPGVYTVELTLFDGGSLAPVPLVDGRLTFDLGRVRLTLPAGRQPEPQFRPEIDFFGGSGPLSLFGYSYDRQQARPGDPFLLTTFMEGRGGSQVYQLQFHLLAPDDQLVTSFERSLTSEDWPFSAWQLGDIWRGQQLFRLPAGLGNGTHRWEICLVPESQTEIESCLGLRSLEINASERLFTRPDGISAVDALYDGNIKLLGSTDRWPASLRTSGLPNQLPITLVWTVEKREVVASYRVFIHVLDSDGALLAQSDAEPDQWNRPTTGWMVGEYVIDRHMVELAPERFGVGRYQLIAGLYDPQTGRRLTLGDGASSAEIGWLRIDE